MCIYDMYTHKASQPPGARRRPRGGRRGCPYRPALRRGGGLFDCNYNMS